MEEITTKIETNLAVDEPIKENKEGVVLFYSNWLDILNH